MTVRITTWKNLTEMKENEDEPCTIENYHGVKSVHIENQTWCDNGLWIVLVYGKDDKQYIGFDEEHDELSVWED